MRPVNLVGFNAAWHLPLVRRRKILREAAKLGAVVAGVETKWLARRDVDAAFPPDEWRVIHQPKPDDRAGCLLALRRDRITAVTNIRYHVGTTAKRRGWPRARMETRWILAADIEIDSTDWRSVFELHLPPARYAWLVGPMLRKLRELMSEAEYPVVVWADWNLPARAVARAMGLNVRHREVVGWAFSPGQNAGRARKKNVGGDHPAVVVTLRDRS